MGPWGYMPFHFKINYAGDLRTECIHLLSGTTINTDAPIDNQGKGEKFSPTDLVCTGLATCMMTIMGIIAKRDGVELIEMSANVEKIMQQSPRKIAEIKIDFHCSNKFDQTYREKLIRAAHTCPVGLSLHPDIKQTIVFNF